MSTLATITHSACVLCCRRNRAEGQDRLVRGAAAEDGLLHGDGRQIPQGQRYGGACVCDALLDRCISVFHEPFYIRLMKFSLRRITRFFVLLAVGLEHFGVDRLRGGGVGHGE